MKKYLSILAITLVAASAFAQGTVSFANNAGSLITYKATVDASAVALPTTLNGRAHLLYAPEAQVISAWAPAIPLELYMAENNLQYVSGAPATVAPVAGRFSGGTRTATSLSPGGIGNFVVIGWAGTEAYASYGDAFNAAMMDATRAWVGVSAPFFIDTGDPTSIPAGSPTVMSSLFSGVTLVPVPEPATFALAGLGAAALLIFRRRN